MKQKMNMDKKATLYFDDDCLLCNGFVQWLIRQDKEEILHFGTLQSKEGQVLAADYLKGTADLSTVIFKEGEKVFTQSTAVLRILRRLGNGWQLLFVFILVPHFIRDGVYRFVARNRYRWFGKKTECLLPDEGLRRRIEK